MVRLIRYLGFGLLGVGGSVVMIGTAAVWWFHGFGAVQDLLSPFNIINWIMVLVALAPGLGLLYVADRLERRQAGPRGVDPPRQ